MAPRRAARARAARRWPSRSSIRRSGRSSSGDQGARHQGAPRQAPANGSAGGGRTVMLDAPTRAPRGSSGRPSSPTRSSWSLDLEGWRPARPATDIRSRAPSTSSARTAAGTRAAPRSAGLSRPRWPRRDPNEYGSARTSAGTGFAANLICFPDGLCRRAVPTRSRASRPRTRRRTASSASAGRSSFPPAAQAADAFVRAREGPDALDALVLERCEASAGRGSGIPGALRSPKVDAASVDSCRTPVLVRRRNGRGAGNVDARRMKARPVTASEPPAPMFAARARLAVR